MTRSSVRSATELYTVATGDVPAPTSHTMLNPLVLLTLTAVASGAALPNPGSPIAAGQWPYTDKFLTVRGGVMADGTPVEMYAAYISH